MGIGVFEQHAVARIAGAFFERLQAGVGFVPWIPVRRRLEGIFDPRRSSVGENLRRKIIRSFNRLLFFREIFLNHRAEMSDQPHIQAIEPHDRFIRTVEVIMPGPVRRRDKITFKHGKAFAFDDRVRVGRAFDDETNGGGGVAMRRGDLTRASPTARKYAPCWSCRPRVRDFSSGSFCDLPLRW